VVVGCSASDELVALSGASPAAGLEASLVAVLEGAGAAADAEDGDTEGVATGDTSGVDGVASVEGAAVDEGDGGVVVTVIGAAAAAGAAAAGGDGGSTVDGVPAGVARAGDAGSGVSLEATVVAYSMASRRERFVRCMARWCSSSSCCCNKSSASRSICSRCAIMLFLASVIGDACEVGAALALAPVPEVLEAAVLAEVPLVVSLPPVVFGG